MLLSMFSVFPQSREINLEQAIEIPDLGFK